MDDINVITRRDSNTNIDILSSIQTTLATFSFFFGLEPNTHPDKPYTYVRFLPVITVISV